MRQRDHGGPDSPEGSPTAPERRQGSRAEPQGQSGPDPYSHRFHAGNVGDVWKHCGLALSLVALRGRGASVSYLDTHAGEGTYDLGPTGEWTEGVGRLWDASPADLPRALACYVDEVLSLGERRERPRRYPGSPRIAASLLGPEDRLILWERDDAARAALGACLGADPRVTLAGGDGFEALPRALTSTRRERPDAELLALVDPPYSDKTEWRAAAQALATAHEAAPRAHLILWYPVKSLTRPNALLAALQRAGIPALVAELVTTPLDLRRNRLNGSGLVLVNPAGGVASALSEGLPILGPLLATRGTAWSARLMSLGAPVETR